MAYTYKKRESPTGIPYPLILQECYYFFAAARCSKCF